MLRIALSFLLFVFLAIDSYGAIRLSVDYEDGTFGNVNTTTDPSDTGYPSLCCAHSAQVVTSPTRVGNRSVRIEARSNDEGLIYGTFQDPARRAEFEDSGFATPIGGEAWFGFSIYVHPSWSDTTDDPNGTIIFQVHGQTDEGEPSRPPPFRIQIKPNDIIHMKILYDDDPITTLPLPSSKRYEFDLANPMVRGEWIDWVVHQQYSFTSGLTEVWRRDSSTSNVWSKVVDETRPNSYNDQRDYSVKWGVYKAWWTNNEPTPPENLIAYYDEIRIGDENSSFAEVEPAPGEAPPPPPPPTPQARLTRNDVGPALVDCVTTQQPGTNNLVIANTNSQVENGVENNTNTTVLIRAGTYNVNNFVVNDGNIVMPYNCENVTIRTSSATNISNDDWIIQGLTFDDQASGGYTLSIQNSDNFIVRYNNFEDADSAFQIVKNASNGEVQFNFFEICGDCDPSDLVRIGDGSNVGQCTGSGFDRCWGGDSPRNIDFSYNWLSGSESTEDCGGANQSNHSGNDFLSVNGVNDTGVHIHNNAFVDSDCMEQFVDFKNGLEDGAEFSRNYMKGPFDHLGSDSFGNGSAPGGCMVGGDTQPGRGIRPNGVDGDCRQRDDCPVHVLHHNYCENGYSIETGPNGTRTSLGFRYGANRYESLKIEFNIDNNDEAFSTGINLMTRSFRSIFRHNSVRGSTFRLRDNQACNDNNGGGDYVIEFINNAWSESYINDGCNRSNPDWNVVGNRFDTNINGGGFSSQHINGVDNVTTNFSFANTGLANPDFTIMQPAHNQKGATPAPQFVSAAINNSCLLSIVMSPFTGFGYNHGPISRVAGGNITVLYGGISQAISNASVSGNSVNLNMANCPLSTESVTFSATHGWCEDSARIGGAFAPNGGINGRCVAVNNQAVTNNVTGGPPPPPSGDSQFWVDNACGTNGTGHEEACGANGPWNSLEFAMEVADCGDMVPGDTLNIKGGTYREPGSINVAGPNGADTGCSGITIQNATGENVIFYGDQDISGSTWTSVGNGVYQCTAGTCGVNDDFPFTAWYAVGGGATQNLNMIQSNTVCDTSLSAGEMRYDPVAGQVCARLSDDSSPASADFFNIPVHRALVIAQVETASNVTWRKNPSGGTFTIQRFRNNIFELHTEDNPGWTFDGLDVGWVLDRCIAYFNGPGVASATIINNTVHHCGQEGIRLTGDTGQCTISNNTITDIQTSPLYELCNGVGTGCQEGFTDNGTGIRLVTNDGIGCTVSNNTILGFGGGRQGRANAINLENDTSNVVVDSNYIARGSGLAIAGRGIVLSASFAGDKHDNIIIRNNRIYDVDICFSQDFGGSFPSQAGDVNKIINNSCLNPQDYGFIAETNGAVDQDGTLIIKNNLFASTNTDDPVFISIPSAQTSGFVEANITNNAFECDNCTADLDIISFKGVGYETDDSCTPATDCVADFSQGHVYGDLFLSTSGGEPTLDITNASSVAVDAGSTDSDVLDDYLGTSRPQGTAYDIGAFESTFAPQVATVEQSKFRFFRVNTQQGQGPKGNENRSFVGYPGSRLVLRMAIRVSGGDSPAREYALFGRICDPTCGAYVEVTTDCTSLSGVCIRSHPFRSNRSLLSSQLGLDGFSFDANSLLISATNTRVSLSPLSNRQVELEYSLGLSSAAGDGDTIELRIRQSNGVDLNSYLQTPVIVVGRGSGTIIK